MDGLLGRVGRKVQDKDVGWRSWRRLTIISWLSDSDMLVVRLQHRSKSLSLVFERLFVTKSKYWFWIYSCFSAALMFQTIILSICGSVSRLHIWFSCSEIQSSTWEVDVNFGFWKVFQTRKWKFSKPQSLFLNLVNARFIYLSSRHLTLLLFVKWKWRFSSNSKWS